MKLRNVLIFGFAIITTLILFTGILSIYKIKEVAKPLDSSIPNMITELGNNSRLDELALNIRYYDEVLTMSARNYAFTSDVKWKIRYNDSAPKLDAFIKQAIDQGTPEDRNFFSNVDAANIALVILEERSIVLVDNGSKDAAITILESDEYWNLKKAYQDGLINYSNRRGFSYNQALTISTVTLKSVTDSTAASISSYTFMVLMFVILGLIVSIGVGIYFLSMVSSPLQILTKGTKMISNGDFNYRISISSNNEFQDLAATFNKMAETLEKTKNLEEEYTMRLDEDVSMKTKELSWQMKELEKARIAALNMMEDLAESNSRLKELDQAKTDFLNIVSHELKTPLTAISAYMDILDDYKPQYNAEEIQSLDAIRRNITQLKDLINNILEMSRMESGKFELNYTDVDITKSLDKIVSNIRILAENKGLKIDLITDKLPTISTDEGRLVEILNNLIGNAIKFTNKGLITVSAKADDKNILISVADTGVGIPDDKQILIFQNFYQADSSISRKFGGTGLGLAITKKIVELQGGKIWFESKVGVGSTFTVRLPIRATQPRKEEEK